MRLDMPERSAVTPRTVVTAVAITLSLLAVAYLTFLAWRVVTWIVIALFLALALDHAVRPLERRGVRRGLAVAIVFVSVLVAFAGLGFLLVPPLVAQVREFVDALPDIVDRISRGRGPLGFLERELDVIERATRFAEEGDFGAAAGALAGPLYSAVESAVIAVVAVVSIVFLVLFLLLYGPDWARGLLGLVPGGSREYWERGARGIYDAIGGWVLGAGMIALVTGIVTTTILLVMGAPYPFLLGIFVAVLDPVPFVGATLGGLVVALVLLGTEGLVPAIVFVLLFTAYTQVENNLLYPVIYGQTVKLSPLAVLVALLIGAQLAGIVGALASIPVAGAVQVVAGEVMRYRSDRDSPTSTRPPPAPRRRGRTRV